MNRVYMISVVKADDHVEARFSPYDITITADTNEHAIELMRECIIGEGTKRKDFDPDDVSDKSDTDCGQAFLWIDMEREYKIRNTSSVEHYSARVDGHDAQRAWCRCIKAFPGCRYKVHNGIREK